MQSYRSAVYLTVCRSSSRLFGVFSRRFLLVAAMAAVLLTWLNMTAPTAYAQTAVTGGLDGVVTDSTGAVVQNATVTIVDTSTGDTRVLTTNREGRYTSPYMKPGMFTISAAANGLKSNTISVQILVSQQSIANLTVIPIRSIETVTVSATNVQLIDTQSANLSTTLTTVQFQNLPAPGGDITSIAYTVPGVVMNTNGGFGYGNFSSNGLPGDSNLIIINGADNNDPFLNINNSGASTNSIGQQEIAQASVVQNGYSPQYGRQAGAIETYVTKGGTDRAHGLLTYTYNSDGLNANDFFNNLNGTPRSKAVSNQYGAQIGGPILHNKLFFFADTEGIRYVTPTVSYVNFPTATLQNTILGTIPSSSVGLYSQMFNLLQTSPFYSTATPITTGSGPLQDSSGALGCGSYAGTPVNGQPNTYFGTAPVGGVAIPCMNAAHATGSALLREWFAAGRVDWNIGDKQKVFARVTDDQGFQPNFTSIINPLLDVQSTQPALNGQLNYTYIFTPNLTNQFIMSGFYYSVPFGPANVQKTLAVSPTEFIEGIDGGTNQSAGLGQGGDTGFDWAYNPIGRNATQYQFIDDFSWLKGYHNLKFGFNFKRYDITDLVNQANTYGGYFAFNSLGDLASGVLPGSSNSSFVQAFTSAPSIHSANYNFGIYAQDEWTATSRLVLDYGIRVDRTGNTLCRDHCFSQYQGGFPDAAATLDTAYNATLSTGHERAFPSIEAAVIQPRFGFAWDTTGKGKTVVRGGIGLFADEYPGALIESEYDTFPDVFAPTVFSGNVAQDVGSAPSFAQASYNTIKTGFAQGQSANQLAATLPAGVPFSPPNYYTTPHEFVNPKYLEWSLQLQQQFTPVDAVIISYAGNHGYDMLIANNTLNQNLGGDAYILASNYTSFDVLPTAPPDPRFGQVGNFSNRAISDYNGVSVQYKHIDKRGLTLDTSYTYAHGLDDMSNGASGEYFNWNSVTSQITSNSVSRLMYSNSDYDIRHNFVFDLVYMESKRFQNKFAELAAGGWIVGSKAYWHSGQPFSVFNDNAGSDLYNGTGPATVLAKVLNNNFSHFCNSFSHPCFQASGLFNGSGVTTADANGDPAQTNFGNVPRNAFYGPHYADVDLSLYKNLFQKGSTIFQVGTQAYNALNHPNFATPQDNASLKQNLGIINGDVVAPTSPYGSFAGSAVSGRVIVVTGRLMF